MQSRPFARRVVSTSILALTLSTSLAPLSGQDAAQRSERFAQTSGGTLRADQAWFDVRHVRLVLRVDPAARTIEGTMVLRARATQAGRSMSLHLDPALEVDGVNAGGAEVDFAHRDGLVTFDFEERVAVATEFRVAVSYGGRPRVAPNPPWKGGFTWSKTRDGKPWIATSCQGEGADLWWPCKDHPSDEPETMVLEITVPKPLVVASNGVLDETVDLGTHRRFRWKTKNPVNNYGVALNIAPYVVIDSIYESVDGTKVPAVFYALPESEKRARAVFPEFLEHLRHMEELCGPYPWRNEKYGVVETPHLGMEHQTIIAYGNRFRKQRFNYDWLHHHEMCHEWWANLVTCRDWKDMWIHEGIGTYMQALWIERTHGKKGYVTEMRSKRRGIRNRRPVAPRVDALDTQAVYFGSGGSDIYNKGSWICHTLRSLLGDERFFRVLRRWAYPNPADEARVDGSQARFVDTAEMLAIAERVSGRDLDWFFEVYLRHAKLPRLVVERRGTRVHLRWVVEGDLPFPMPVPVHIGDREMRVDMKDGAGSFELPSGAEFTIDPDSWLLKEQNR